MAIDRRVRQRAIAVVPDVGRAQSAQRLLATMQQAGNTALTVIQGTAQMKGNELTELRQDAAIQRQELPSMVAEAFLLEGDERDAALGKISKEAFGRANKAYVQSLVRMNQTREAQRDKLEAEALDERVRATKAKGVAQAMFLQRRRSGLMEMSLADVRGWDPEGQAIGDSGGDDQLFQYLLPLYSSWKQTREVQLESDDREAKLIAEQAFTINQLEAMSEANQLDPLFAIHYVNTMQETMRSHGATFSEVRNATREVIEDLARLGAAQGDPSLIDIAESINKSVSDADRVDVDLLERLRNAGTASSGTTANTVYSRQINGARSNTRLDDIWAEIQKDPALSDNDRAAQLATISAKSQQILDGVRSELAREFDNKLKTNEQLPEIESLGEWLNPLNRGSLVWETETIIKENGDHETVRVFNDDQLASLRDKWVARRNQVGGKMVADQQTAAAHQADSWTGITQTEHEQSSHEYIMQNSEFNTQGVRSPGEQVTDFADATVKQFRGAGWLAEETWQTIDAMVRTAPGAGRDAEATFRKGINTLMRLAMRDLSALDHVQPGTRLAATLAMNGIGGNTVNGEWQANDSLQALANASGEELSFVYEALAGRYPEEEIKEAGADQFGPTFGQRLGNAAFTILLSTMDAGDAMAGSIHMHTIGERDAQLIFDLAAGHLVARKSLSRYVGVIEGPLPNDIKRSVRSDVDAAMRSAMGEFKKLRARVETGYAGPTLVPRRLIMPQPDGKMAMMHNSLAESERLFNDQVNVMVGNAAAFFGPNFDTLQLHEAKGVAYYTVKGQLASITGVGQYAPAQDFDYIVPVGAQATLLESLLIDNAATYRDAPEQLLIDFVDGLADAKPEG